jgi:hypothetical protein
VKLPQKHPHILVCVCVDGGGGGGGCCFHFKHSLFEVCVVMQSRSPESVR